MAGKSTHPYVPAPGSLVQIFTQFRKAMPAQVDASTLKRLGIAPGNESVVLGVLRFLGFIDENGGRTKDGQEVFLKHDDGQFAKALEKIIKSAYKDLFDLRGEESWALDRDTLIGFFRATDETSLLTAKRQSITFETLSALSGHGEVSAARPKQSGQARVSKKASTKKVVPVKTASQGGQITNPGTGKPSAAENGEMALTVRIEVNLPAQADQETYDRIFKSIRANLLNG